MNEPLGNLENLNVSHDNSGRASMASWFLKLAIVHDLQTRIKYYFICNKWLAFDQGDQKINRLLPVCLDAQKKGFKFLFEKKTKDKLSDDHLWFSIYARPLLSAFSRLDRLICCFVLLSLSMMMNILYYSGDSAEPQSDGLVIGPITITVRQVLVGIITNVVVFPPSVLLVQAFRRCPARVSRLERLRSAIKSLKKNQASINKRYAEIYPARNRQLFLGKFFLLKELIILTRLWTERQFMFLTCINNYF